MGFYLERGYGLKQDKDLALKYYRKSADLGSPEGQYLVAELLAPIDNAPEVAVQMWRCAAEQGYAKAGLSLGIRLKNTARHDQALQAFQLGAKAGEDGAASFLTHGFDGPAVDDQLYYLGQHKDPERDRRHFVAGEMLPTVLVPVQRSLIQKLTGGPRNQLAETTWTLIAYPVLPVAHFRRNLAARNGDEMRLHGCKRKTAALTAMPSMF